MTTPFITICDVCGKPTWYETEQPCKMQYPKIAICNLEYSHEELDDDGLVIMKPCKGTLRKII